MGLRSPEFLDNLQTITGQDPTERGPLAVRLHFGNADPVNYVHILAEAQEVEDLFKSMGDGPNSDVLSGGRQRRGGRRDGGYLDMLAGGRGNSIMDNILLQQTLDMMDDIIRLGREIEALDRQIEADDQRYLTEEERAEMAGMTEAEKDAYRLEKARERLERGDITQAEYDARVRSILERQEKKDELAEFMDEYIDQIRQANSQYRELIRRRTELNDQLTANEALTNRLGELREEGENEQAREELDGIIRTRQDLDVNLAGNETFDEKITAVEVAVERQTVQLTEELGEVGLAIEKIEEADEVLTREGYERQIKAAADNANLEATGQERIDAQYAAVFNSANGEASAVEPSADVETAAPEEVIKPPTPIDFG